MSSKFKPWRDGTKKKKNRKSTRSKKERYNSFEEVENLEFAKKYVRDMQFSNDRLDYITTNLDD